jgi:hypothetical protein
MEKRKQVAPRKTYNGKPVFDSTEPLTVKIGKADIRGAKIRSPEDCAAARSLKRQDEVVDAHVYRAVTLVEYKDHVERYTTPEVLGRETVKFDQTGRFDEGDYHLRPPVGNRVLGADQRRSDRGGGDDKSRRAPAHYPVGVRPIGPRSYR